MNSLRFRDHAFLNLNFFDAPIEEEFSHQRKPFAQSISRRPRWTATNHRETAVKPDLALSDILNHNAMP